MKAERGFSLVEFLVVTGVVAILTVGIVTMTLAHHPSELVSATRAFDASLAAARAIAATSGNGATMVLAPRAPSGFALTVYRGRPTAANAVSTTTVMPVVSDIAVKETTLGSPPFAIFLSGAGHASGRASYPSFDNAGNPVFSTIAQQPACPKGSLTLTFTNGLAAQTRTLPCRVFATGSAQPLPTATPAQIVLTPGTLVFAKPGAPAQTFVATEWGYTGWFSANSFACGANIAAFPQSNPAPPYSPPFSTADASATPQPPANLPYSFANSATSMEDAPATFVLVPQNAGTCSVTITDANAQQQTVRVTVLAPPTPPPTPTPAPTPTPTLAPTPSPSPTPEPCPTGASTLLGADGTCDDAYQWAIDSEYTGSGFATEYEAFYVPHGTRVGYYVEPLGAGQGCGTTLITAAPITVYANFSTMQGAPSQSVPNPAGFGTAQIPNAATVTWDSGQPPPTPIPALCNKKLLPGPL